MSAAVHQRKMLVFPSVRMFGALLFGVGVSRVFFGPFGLSFFWTPGTFWRSHSCKSANGWVFAAADFSPALSVSSNVLPLTGVRSSGAFGSLTAFRYLAVSAIVLLWRPMTGSEKLFEHFLMARKNCRWARF